MMNAWGKENFLPPFMLHPPPAAAGWQLPAEPTMPRLNSPVLGFLLGPASAGSGPPPSTRTP